jgi:hypothetical protein
VCPRRRRPPSVQVVPGQRIGCARVGGPVDADSPRLHLPSPWPLPCELYLRDAAHSLDMDATSKRVNWGNVPGRRIAEWRSPSGPAWVMFVAGQGRSPAERAIRSYLRRFLGRVWSARAWFSPGEGLLIGSYDETTVLLVFGVGTGGNRTPVMLRFRRSSSAESLGSPIARIERRPEEVSAMSWLVFRDGVALCYRGLGGPLCGALVVNVPK